VPDTPVPSTLSLMARLCERPACSERGAIAYGFDPDRLLVWLAPLDPDADRMRAGVLCLRHADAMVVPLGWTLDDARDPKLRLFRPAKQPRAPRTKRPRARPAAPTSEQLPLDDAAASSPGVDPGLAERTVANVTGVSALDDPDATTALPWKPDFDESDDLDGLLDAQTPLLTRAFRGPGAPR
jgi:hypothetical protein